MGKLSFLMIAPLPPPFAGPEISTQILLENDIQKFFDFHFIKSNIRKTNKDKGKFDIGGLRVFIKIYFKAIRVILKHKIDSVYILLSQNQIGFLRDTIYIWTFRILGCRVIAHLRGSNFLNFYNSRSFLYRLIIKKTLRQLKFLIVQSDSIINQFKDLLPLNRIHVLSNCIDGGKISKPRKLNSKIGGSKGRRVLLYVGYLTFAKGFYDLLQIIPNLIQENPDLEFWFVGEKFDKERNIILKNENIKPQKIESIRKEYESHIKLIGTLENPELLKKMRQADIFVSPSYSEGFPMSILEAMSCGLPIVATKVGAVSDIIIDEKNGFIYEPGDLNKLYQHIITVLNDFELYNRMSVNNIKDVTNKYSTDKVIPEFVKLMNKSKQD